METRLMLFLAIYHNVTNCVRVNDFETDWFPFNWWKTRLSFITFAF